MRNEVNTQGTERIYKTVRRKTKKIKGFSLKSEECLTAYQVTSIWATTYEIDPETKKRSICDKHQEGEEIQRIEYKLTEVTVDKLMELRQKNFPMFILKNKGRYFYTKIPKKTNLVSAKLINHHLCANSSGDCKHLSAMLDEDGGCQKVRDKGKNKRIEKYPWITTGYETVGTEKESFFVAECEHCE